MMCKDSALQQTFLGKAKNSDLLKDPEILKSLVSFTESKSNPNNADIKLLTTTSRIRQFSEGKTLKDSDHVVYIDGGFDLLR